MDATTTRPALWPDHTIQTLNARFHERPPEELLRWATEQFGRQVALTVSFGGTAGMVLLDLVVRHELPIAVIFLDTGLLFPETYALAETAARHYGITIERHQPGLSLEAQEHQYGPALYARDPDQCCTLRKVTPLRDALRPYDAWISGIRRDQTAQRATTEPVQWSAKHDLLKLSPLAAWSEREVWAYLNTHHMPYNPLLDQGYPSLGCAPCTHPVGADAPRSGRWSAFTKTECGLHLES